MESAKLKYRTVCVAKDCTSCLDKDLDVIFHSFPTVKCIGNLQKIDDQVKAWKKL